MVLALCRRVLGDVHAAEDAFQATFLVLARKAPSLLRQELVGNWLWGVAYRTARRAKIDAARWHSRKREVHRNMAPDPVEEVMWRDLQPVLDEEIYLLPAKYRQPFVLCYLEGKTNEEAARRLGCPSGTVFTRLARARELLRGRLTRRGITLSAAAIAVGVTSQATARVPARVASSTVKAAAHFTARNAAVGATTSIEAYHLADAALHLMFANKVKTIAIVLFAITTLGGAAAIYAQREQAAAKTESDHNRSPAILAQLSANTPHPPMPDKQAAEKKLQEEKPKTEILDLGKRFGFGRGFGMGRDSATATATVNTGEHSESVNRTVPGSSKLAALYQPASERDLPLSSKQLQQIRALQEKQKVAMRAMAPRQPADAAHALEVLREIERTAEKLRKLATEIDSAIDEILTDEQRERLKPLEAKP
jgi:RNA polymerase sigma factor (sigma-70 family)